MRRGVTLLEVLFAIAIAAIGILGVMGTLVVAGKQAADAARIDGADRVGRNAIREFSVRGYDVAVGPQGTWATIPVIGRSYCIDPRYVAANGTSSPASWFPAFDPASVPGARMYRISVRAMPGNQLASPSLPIGVSLADSIFVAKDDLVFNLPDDRTLTPIQNYGTAVESRDYEGAFSWFATIQPIEITSQWYCQHCGLIWSDNVILSNVNGSLQTVCLICLNTQGILRIVVRTGVVTNEDSGNSLLNIVVCHRRNLSDSNAERLANVLQIEQDEFKLSARPGQPDSDLEAKEGSWMLLCGVNQTNVQAFLWRRVVGTKDVVPANTPDYDGTIEPVATRWLSTFGRDWSIPSAGTQVALFDSVVAVYEKTIRMEE